MTKTSVLCVALMVLWGCEGPPPPAAPDEEAAAEIRDQPAAQPAPDQQQPESAQSPSDRLDAILEAKPADFRARYEHRHPKETLEFFGIEPGMTVVEALPGSGWYSQVLIPYLGPQGQLIGANYARDLWPKFGLYDQEYLDAMETWVSDWPEQAQAWRGEDGAEVEAFEFGALPEHLVGQADAVLLIRALHNLVRFENDGGYLTAALNDVNRVLKPGGIVGVVQHEARPDMPDDWASGNAGYLKKQFVIDRMVEAGLELVDESSVNENPLDQPTPDDVVWRLPPSHATSAGNPELRAEMEAIGESNRMTLKFRKPG